jgi:hypothetical protein
MGVLESRTAISWAGVLGLAAFSFLSLFSIGLLYFPLVLILVGLLPSLRGPSSDSRRGPYMENVAIQTRNPPPHF